MQYPIFQAQGWPIGSGIVESACAQINALGTQKIPDALMDVSAYHYYPGREQVRTWLEETGLRLELEGKGIWYAHFVCTRGFPEKG
jgi:hypothetical protein